MEPFVIRPYAASDFAAFVAAQSLAFRRLALGAYSAQALAAVERARNTPEREREMLEIAELVAVARDGAIVGGAGWTPQPNEAATARIRRVFVHPDHAGRGLGRRLVSAAEAGARHGGFSRFVVCASKNAVPFYEKLGYRGLRPEPRKYEDLIVDFLLMEKP